MTGRSRGAAVAVLLLVEAVPAGAAEGIVPVFPERGLSGYAGPGVAGPTGQTAAGGATTGSAGAVSTGSGAAAPTTTDTAALLQQTSYGGTALTAASQLGENFNSLAAIGYAESKFQNVPTQLGTSAATGPWQFVPDTFNGVSAKYGLGYAAADIDNPDAQAVAAAYLLRDTANAVSAATQQPATTVQTYMGWVFGPTAAARIATASPDTPIASFMPVSYLTNNQLPLTTTVQQIDDLYGQRLGSAANQTVLTPS